MEKLIFNLHVSFFILLSVSSLFGQEEVKYEVSMVRDITPDNKVESYLEIRDSALAVLDILKEKWGDEPEVNGKMEWSNASIDSIDAKVRVVLYHGFKKNNGASFKLYPTSRKDKPDEVRIIRLRFLQKDKDLLSSVQTTLILKNFLYNILIQVFEGADNETQESD